MKFEIKHRFTGAVLFSLDCGSLKICVEAAVKSGANLAGAYLAGAYLAGAYLADAYLAGAYLADAYLAGANLTGAYLTGAYLADAYLAGANLTGAYLTGAYLGKAAELAEIARLDAVREVVLAQPERLRMSSWHSKGWDATHTPEEEHTCNSAHCIAGWLQAQSDDVKIREMDPESAGRLLAPASSWVFYQSDKFALDWLKERKYAQPAQSPEEG